MAAKKTKEPKKRGAPAPALPSPEALEAAPKGPSATVVRAADSVPPSLREDSEVATDVDGLVVVPGQTSAMPPEDEEVAAAIETTVESPLSEVVLRAMRFVDKTAPQVRVYPNMVVGVGHAGTVYAPWNVPGLSSHVVDGRRLYAALRAAGAEGQVHASPDGGLVVVGAAGDRTKLAAFGGVVGDPIPFPAADVKWVPAKPAEFRQAKVFAGDDKIEPPHLAGVAVVGGAALATDRRGAISSRTFTDATLPLAILPRTMFDGVTDDVVYLSVAEQTQHIAVAVPSTGEYRIARSLGSTFPDIQSALERFGAGTTFWVGVDKEKLRVALRKMTVVQSRLSAVHVQIFRSFPKEPGDVSRAWFRVSGGYEGAEYEAVFEVRTDAPLAEPFTITIKAELLLKLVAVALGAEIRMGFGADARSPLVVDEGSYRALLLAMVT